MFKRFFIFLVIVGISAGSFYSVRNSQDIIDWWRLRDYEPTPAIVNLADSAGFSDFGRKLFYVHDPQLLPKWDFANKCTVGNETIVLGCYISHQSINLFDIEDERLAGGEEVTAAHEMLHAAFDRLTPKEQDDLEKMLVAAFNDLKDKRIEEVVRTYERRDKSVVPNELHSILGTDIRNLPGPLEEHYRKYFTDRSKVVDLAEKYNDEFARREAEVANYDEQLASIQGEIVRLESDVRLQNEALARERSILEGLKDNPESYNAGVVSYNQLVRSYNGDVETLKGKVETYNKLVEERNTIAIEERELVNAIDTRVEQLSQ